MGRKEKEKWEKKQKKAAKKMKPLMNGINSMRAKLCWTRSDFWNHEKCIKFLGVICSKGSTGQGICRRFSRRAAKKCQNEDTRVKKKYCPMLKKYKLVQVDDEEDVKKDTEDDEKKAKK